MPARFPYPASGALRVLETLPAELEWMVMFRLEMIRRFANDETIRAMYFLPPECNLQRASHIILTSAGRALFCNGACVPLGLATENLAPARCTAQSLAGLYSDELDRLLQTEPDCLGLGNTAGRSTAWLHLVVNGCVGYASALFVAAPDTTAYEYLGAIGVHYLGGEQTAQGFLAKFTNRISEHVLSGRRAGFTRTANCNDFFIKHGELDAILRSGLEAAFARRLDEALRTLHAVAAKLGTLAGEQTLAMTCIPPPPDAAFAYGNLVPLAIFTGGFRRLQQDLVRAPFVAMRDARLLGRLMAHIDAARGEGGLWAFEQGRLVTATDSALVMLSSPQTQCLDGFTRYWISGEGYLPQLANDVGGAEYMQRAPENRHWRQADYASSCLIRGLHRLNEIDSPFTLAQVAQGFAQRAGLYFANPYLVDWCVALAIHNEPCAKSLQLELVAEILASANADGSFGRFDETLSTALALGVLNLLGYRGPETTRAGLHLIKAIEEPVWPVSQPFYSTFIAPDNVSTIVSPQLFQLEGDTHECSLYEDTHRLVLVGFIADALMAFKSDATCYTGVVPAHESAHPRYLCDDVISYISSFALTPYVAHAP